MAIAGTETTRGAADPEEESQKADEALEVRKIRGFLFRGQSFAGIHVQQEQESLFCLVPCLEFLERNPGEGLTPALQIAHEALQIPESRTHVIRTSIHREYDSS